METNKKRTKKKRIKLAYSEIIKTVLITFLTVALTKGCDLLFPSKVSFKEVPIEHMVIEHSFDYGEATNDSLMQQRINNLAKLEKIEAQIKRKINSYDLNQVLINNLCPNAKGYSIGNSSPYCSIDIIQSAEGYFDSTLCFFDGSIIDSICFVGIKVLKIQADGKMVYVFDINYLPKVENTMRIANTFEKGKYKFEIGFTFKKDNNASYPTFYSQSRIVDIQ